MLNAYRSVLTPRPLDQLQVKFSLSKNVTV